MIKGQGTPVKL